MNIFFAINDKYVQHLCVTLVSVIENNKDLNINFFVLHNNVSEKNIELVKDFVSKYENKNIDFVKIDLKKFCNIKLNIDYISIETYFRFLIPTLFPNMEKALYLDVDIAVNGSLEELWTTDLENSYIAGVKELYLYKLEYPKKLKFSSQDLYINAGAILLNIPLMIKDDLVNKLFKNTKKYIKKVLYQDQDILNITCKGRIKELDYKYNFTKEHGFLYIDDAKNAKIIHWNGYDKPWNLYECRSNSTDLYFKYLALTPFRPKVKIFSFYHNNKFIFKTDVIEPMQNGVEQADDKLPMLHDNTGDNISSKNPYYAELTGNYWVWKNYIKEHPETEYIGFCHYRRFLDFDKPAKKDICFAKSMNVSSFVKEYSNSYNAHNIYEKIRNYDVVLPELHHFNEKEGCIYKQYSDSHPKEEIDKLINIIKADYPDYVQDMEEYLNGYTGYFCLNYVMKTPLFDEFMTWCFDLLNKMDKITDWTQYKEYLNQKTPAYLMERFFNVWLRHKIRVNDIKVLNREGIILTFGVKEDKVTYGIIPGISITHSGISRIVNVFGIKISAKKIKAKGYNTLLLGKYKFTKYKENYFWEKFIKKHEPKLVATLLVRDEIDIIEENIKFHLNMGVDFIIATDNGSVDGTRDILLKYQKMGILKLIDEPEQDYNQVKWVDRMIKMAKKDYKADWIINLDADEFWYSERGNLKEDLMLLNKYNVIYVPSLFIYPEKDASTETPFYCAVKGAFKDLKKCIHKTKGYKKIHMGSHDVDIADKKYTFYTGIQLFHYFMRSYEQFEHKIVITGKALQQNSNLKLGQGGQALFYYQQYIDGHLKNIYWERISEKHDIVNCKVKDYIENNYKTLKQLWNDNQESSIYSAGCTKW